MYKLAKVLTIFFSGIIASTAYSNVQATHNEVVTKIAVVEPIEVPSPISSYEPIVIIDQKEETIVEELPLSYEDIELIALVTMAEAEGESEEGKRLVIDTILNRMDSAYFPDTIYDVIYQPYQFSSMWNGRVNRCQIRADICQLVVAELKNRTNYDVMFFTSGGYSKYGTPMFKVENHYFSSY